MFLPHLTHMTMMAMNLKLKSLIILFCTLSQAFDNSGICETSSHDGDSNQPFCCDFYEKTSNGCVACGDGFESRGGIRCAPCSSNTYGNWCAEICVCTTNQRCDNIDGCVDIITTVALYPGYSKVIKYVTEKETSNDKTSTETQFKPILIYIVAAGSITFVLTTTIIIIKRKRYTQNNRIQREDRITNIQIQNEQHEQYSTIL